MRVALCVAGVLLCSAMPGAAQPLEFWPEVDAFVRLSSKARLLLVATTVQRDGETTDGEFGADLDLHLKPLRRAPALMFRLDESKNRVLVIRGGYHYLRSYTGGAPENRGVLEVTVRYPLKGPFGHVLLSNRNRTDLRVIEDTYSWRYRNRLSAERELSVGPVRVNPYARFEAFFDSRFDAFTRTELMTGASFPMARYLEVEAYFLYQHDTGSGPNKKTRAIATVATIYF